MRKDINKKAGQKKNDFFVEINNAPQQVPQNNWAQNAPIGESKNRRTPNKVVTPTKKNDSANRP